MEILSKAEKKALVIRLYRDGKNTKKSFRLITFVLRVNHICNIDIFLELKESLFNFAFSSSTNTLN